MSNWVGCVVEGCNGLTQGEYCHYHKSFYGCKHQIQKESETGNYIPYCELKDKLILAQKKSLCKNCKEKKEYNLEEKSNGIL